MNYRDKHQKALARSRARAKGEPKKGKSSKYNFQDDGNIGLGLTVHV